MPRPRLLTELELLRNSLIAVQVRVVQVIQQTAALANHHQEPSTGAMILLVLLQVLSQVIDPLREQRNLHIRRTCIPLVELEIVNRFRFRLHVFCLIRSVYL